MAESPQALPCIDCPAAKIVSDLRDVVAGTGAASTEEVNVGIVDFQGYDDPDELAKDMSTLTRRVTYSELIREGVTPEHQQALVTAAEKALQDLGTSACNAACQGPSEGTCQAPAGSQAIYDVADAYFNHIMFTWGD